MKILIDVTRLDTNTQAMAEFAKISKNHSQANCYKQPIRQEPYYQQEASEIEKLIQKYSAKKVVTKEYDNGLKEFAYLDLDGRLIATYTGLE